MYSGVVNVVFMYFYCSGNGNGISRESDKNKVLTLVVPVTNKGENDIIFLFSHFFLVPQKGFTTKKCEKKIVIFYFNSLF